MREIKEIYYSKTFQKFDLKNLPDGVLAFFVVEADGEFASKQKEMFDKKSEEFAGKGLSVFFVSESETEKDGYLVDKGGEIKSFVESLKDAPSAIDNLLIFTKVADEIVFSERKEYPENEYDWSDNLEHFITNYNDKNEPQDGLWKWGQVVPEDGDYLCVDCGYIEEMKKGQTFPICVVCLSGEVDGPTGPEGGYWEKV